MNNKPVNPQQRADRVGGQQIPKLLLAFVAAVLQVDGHLGRHGDLATQAWLSRPGQSGPWDHGLLCLFSPPSRNTISKE